jgi:hypothetical protein
MRTETYFAGAALVRDLESTGTIAHVHHDGGDIIHVEMRTGEHAWIHLIESSIPQVEVIQTHVANAEKDLYTLLLFWADRLLPPHLHFYEPEEWMRPLLALYGDKLYGYEVHGRDISIFPVYFEGAGNLRYIRYGQPVAIGRFTCRRRTLRTGDWDGEHLWVDFSEMGDSAKGQGAAAAKVHPLERHYAALGLTSAADARAVKRAYRRLAREYHPDLNGSNPTATARMQQINEAYARIIAGLTTK